MAMHAVVVALVSIIIATALGRLLRHYLRRLQDDSSRIDAARAALKAQKQWIDRILDSDIIANSIKTFVLDLSEVVPDHAMAYRLAKWMESGMPEPDTDKRTNDEADELFNDLRNLRSSHPEAFELAVGGMRGAIVTIMLQWPATARCMQRISYKLAVESSTEVAKSAARFQHWADTRRPLAA
jgi:hypothetical protein